MKFCLILLSLLAVLPMKSETHEDFVGLLVSSVQEQNEQLGSLTEDDYKCITVGPSMIEKVMSLAPQTAEMEKISKMIPNIKSLRIFMASNHSAQFEAIATDLLKKNKSRYKAYKTKDGRDVKKNIWVQKSNGKVVEIVMVHAEGGLKIVDVTGNMTDEFISSLMKL